MKMRNHLSMRGSLVLAATVALAPLGCDSDPSGLPTPHPVITTETLPAGVVGEAYSEGVNADGGGGEYSWSLLDGALPPGLALSVDDLTDSDLLITGTPETEGTYEFSLEVEVPDGRSDTAALEITIVPQLDPVAVVTPRLPPALAGAAYRVELRAANDDVRSYTWRVVEGTLPDGVTLGADGAFSGVPTVADTFPITVEAATATDSARASFALPVVAETPETFAITPFHVVDVAPTLEDNLADAIARWEAALVGDLAPIAIPAGSNGFQPGACGGFGELANGTAVDDILILINIDSIDGTGGEDNILGRAGPCAVRIQSNLPAVGILTLDEADLKLIEQASEELVTDLIQHEMAHILGFGTLWQDPGDPSRNLVVIGDSTDPRYIGEQAVAEYQAAGGTAESIAVEEDGGEGTWFAHWEEEGDDGREGFDEELMTGFAEAVGVEMPLSRMSIASFADLGYQVDLSVAEVAADVFAGLFRYGTSNLRSIGRDVVGVGPILVLGAERRTYLPGPGARNP